MTSTTDMPSRRALIAAAEEAGHGAALLLADSAIQRPGAYPELIALARRIEAELSPELEYALRVAREVLARRFEKMGWLEDAAEYRDAKWDHLLTRAVEYLRPLLKDENDVL